MVRVDLMDHFRDLVDCIPDLGVGVVQVQLVADAPYEQGRVVFQFQHLPPDVFELGLHGGRIVVVEAVALAGHFNAHGHHQAVGVGLVQYFPARALPVFGAPGAEGIPVVFGQGGDVPEFEACPLNVEGFPVDHQGVFPPLLFKGDFRRPLGFPGLRNFRGCRLLLAGTQK